MEAHFCKIAETFEVDGHQMLNAFEEILQRTALMNWEQLTDDLTVEEKMLENFDELMPQYYM